MAEIGLPPESRAHLEIERLRDEAEKRVRESDVWLSGQRAALEAALNGAPLETSLDALVSAAIARLSQGVRAAFYLANPECTELSHIVGMSAGYAEAVEGFKIGPESVACGLAMHTGRPVIANDVTLDPLWEPWLWMAEKFDYRSCWSFPINTKAGKFVGTFALYWPQPHATAQAEVEFAALVTQAAAIIISHQTEVRVRQQAEQALREADRQKDEFLAMLAHELRNPLSPILNAAELLKRIGLANVNQRRACEVIERQTQHLTRLVDDLLDVSRITQGKITLQREPLELATIINRAVEASRPLVEARRHQLTITLPPEAARVDGDLTRLVQVVSNLVNNAAKYTDEGGHIHITAAAEGGEASVSVRDDGIGLHADLLPHVFNLFTQADRSLDRSQGGLGIGLTLVRQLVELHGGRAEAHSEGPGRGSEFIVRLPLAQVEAVVLGGRRTQSPAPDGEGCTPLRVLVVEDNVDSAEIIGSLLELIGHELRLTHDGMRMFDVVRDFQPQVILCDIGLPGMSGYEVARKLRAEPEFKQTRLIAISGYGRDEDRSRAQEAGFDYYLVKPVELDTLAALLESVH